MFVVGSDGELMISEGPFRRVISSLGRGATKSTAG